MKKRTEIPRRQSDALLKGTFEDNFADFLRFLIPDAYDTFDLSRGVEFRDKELLAIVPDRERQGGGRVTDLLAKVYLKNGGKEYFLVNTEIEGGNDPEFAKRMYQYNYRIWDKHDVPVTSIAFYIGGPKQPRPSEYSVESTGTRIHFRFLAYHILEHSESELLAMGNIFGQIVAACQHSRLEGEVSDEILGHNRMRIAKALIRHGYDRERVIAALVFLKNFLHVRDPEINSTFDEELIRFSGGKDNMGVIEVVKEWQRQLGREEGREESKREVVENLIEKMGLSNEQIMNIAGVSLDFVLKIRTELPEDEKP